MPLLLARIDDRLVHGQVVIGCCEPLRARRLVLCDTEVARDPVLRGLFALGMPEGVELEVLEPAPALERLSVLERTGEARATILLVARCAAMLQLARGGARLDRVNLGGAHARQGAQEVWPGFFLDAEDQAALRGLLDRGIPVQVQSVPGGLCVEASIDVLPTSPTTP